MGDKVKRYRVKDVYCLVIEKIEFFQFFYQVVGSNIFGMEEEFFNREFFLKDFKFLNEDIKIDFDWIFFDFYKVDFEEGKKNEY